MLQSLCIPFDAVYNMQSEKLLSAMTVTDVINMVGRVDGFNRQMIDDYGRRLAENNINGAVLLSCDLTELKAVLQMAFGDWVLFRSMVESLRYSEQNGELADGELSPPMEVFVRQTAASGSGKAEPRTTSVGVANAAAPSTKKPTVSDMMLTSAVSDCDTVSAGPSRSSPTLKDPLTSGDRDVTDDIKPAAASSPPAHPPLNRQDSFVSEFLMESETLRGFIQASVLGSDSDGGNQDSDDDVQRPITTIPEESQAVSRNTSASSLGRSSLRQMSLVRRTSVESGPIDRAFSVGPDHDSGESDSELEQVSRKSSIRHAIAAHSGTAGARTDLDQTPGSSAAEDRRKKSTSKSTKQDSHRSSTKHADKSKSASKLDRGGNEVSVPLMSLYFPMACDRGHGGGTSQSSNYVSPKASQTAISQAASSSGGHRLDDADCTHSGMVAVTSLSSSSPSGLHSRSPSSAANHAPSSDVTGRVTPSPPSPQHTESAEADSVSDNVKFFIVDESEASPKAVLVEMDAFRITSSSSSRHDLDHVPV